MRLCDGPVGLWHPVLSAAEYEIPASLILPLVPPAVIGLVSFVGAV